MVTVAEAESAPFPFCRPVELADPEAQDSESEASLDASAAETALCSLSSLPWRCSSVSSPSEAEAASLLLPIPERFEIQLRTDERSSSDASVERLERLQGSLETTGLRTLAEDSSPQADWLDSGSDVCRGELLAGGAEVTATELTLPQASESDIVAATTAHRLSNTALIKS